MHLRPNVTLERFHINHILFEVRNEWFIPVCTLVLSLQTAVKCHFNHQLCDDLINRVRDLMRSGVIKPTEKPIWYDVYQAFPPKRDPLHVKPSTRLSTKKQETVPEIFYREDVIRA